MPLQIANRLADKCLEFLKDDHAVHSLFSWHPHRINGAYLHVLFFDLLGGLLKERRILLFQLFARIAHKAGELKRFHQEAVLAKLLHEVVQMLKSSLDETSFHIADGSLWGDGRNVIPRPTFTQCDPEQVEV